MTRKNTIFRPALSLTGSQFSAEERALLITPVHERSDRLRRQRVLLKAMGIEYWHLKQGPHLSQGRVVVGPPGYIYELCCAEQSVGLLLATAEQQSSDVEQLLLKIIKAIHCSPGIDQWCSQPSEEVLCFSSATAAAQQQPDWLFIVTLGEGWNTSFSTAVIVKGDAPKQLINNPALKGRTWKALQAVFPLLEKRLPLIADRHS